MAIKSEKARTIIESDGVPTSDGILMSQMCKSAVVKVVEIAEDDMRQKAILAFDNSCKDCGQLCDCQDCDFRKEFIKNLE